MAFSSDRRFVPAHFVGTGRYRKRERAHYADSAGNWVSGPPRPVAGYTQSPPAAKGMPTLAALLAAKRRS